MTIIELTAEQQELLKNLSSQIFVDGKKWHYMPFWFKEKEGAVYEVCTFEQLPERVKEIIKRNSL